MATVELPPRNSRQNQCKIVEKYYLKTPGLSDFALGGQNWAKNVSIPNNLAAVLEAGGDETLEEWMGFVRLGLEFRMKLARQEPRVVP